MSLAVVDASVLTAFYVVDDPRREHVREHLGSGRTLFAPAHIDAEVVSALRGLSRVSPRVTRAAPAALRHLAGLPLRRMPIAPLVERMWELRTQMTAYDAAYVALAERLNAVVVTCDQKMAAATKARCGWEVVR